MGLKDHPNLQASPQAVTSWLLWMALVFVGVWIVTHSYHSHTQVAVPVLAAELANIDSNTQVADPQAAGTVDEVPIEAGEEFVAPTFGLCPGKTVDFIPCLDNEKAIAALTSRKHYEHRERHCPTASEREELRCLVPMPEGYKQHIRWPQSRDEIWYANVPHPSLANYKADQNWVRPEGEKFVFPGGGTQFKAGAKKYIQWLHEAVPVLGWGDNIRVALDMGCGVASFAAYMESFGTRVMSVAPKDEHDAQIQFALERGVSALVGVMGTQRQPYPASVFDIVHCARCRVPWHADGGMLLLELNRLIRPGGYFVWSATPVCPDCKAKEPDDKEVWEAMSDLTQRMCWHMVAKNISSSDGIGVAVWQKPTSNECYANRPQGTEPPMCADDDNPDAGWYAPMKACLHYVPTDADARGSSWPTLGRARTTALPPWLTTVRSGIYGRPAPIEFEADRTHWARVLRSYVADMGVEWSTVRNVMDMDSRYGGFGGALESSPLQVWTMNVVPTIAPNTLPVIFDRGLLGVYHDWCESFNTYPRTYDLLHADHILGQLDGPQSKCGLVDVMVEMDRILRPLGYVIIRDTVPNAQKIQSIAENLHWELGTKSVWQDLTVMSFKKTMWRPDNSTSLA